MCLGRVIKYNNRRHISLCQILYHLRVLISHMTQKRKVVFLIIIIHLIIIQEHGDSWLNSLLSVSLQSLCHLFSASKKSPLLTSIIRMRSQGSFIWNQLLWPFFSRFENCHEKFLLFFYQQNKAHWKLIDIS